MCRVLAYLGEPVLADGLLFQADSSLIHQSYAPRLAEMLNLAGFGLLAWDPRSPSPQLPFSYHTTALPIFDRNLKRLAVKLRPDAFIAHVRGVPYNTGVTLSDQNLHPFQFDGTRLALAHNGQLDRFTEIRDDLIPHIELRWRQQIRGNTDSEWIYALLLSQLADPSGRTAPADLADAVRATLSILRKVREGAGIVTNSPMNLFISDGEMIASVRFVFDFGCYPVGDGKIDDSMMNFQSLWYTCGRDYGRHDGKWKMIGGPSGATSIILSSEPLSEDRATWLEVSEYSMFAATRTNGLVVREEFALDA